MNKFRELGPLAQTAIVANLVGLLILAIVGFTLYERNERERAIAEAEQPYMTFLNVPFPVLDTKVASEKIVRLVIQRHSNEKVMRIYPIAARLIADDKTLGLPPVMIQPGTSSVEPGDTEVISALNRIPPSPPGMYHIEGTAEIQGVHKLFILPWSSQSFEITATN